jgi:hypothetical protein
MWYEHPREQSLIHPSMVVAPRRRSNSRLLIRRLPVEANKIIIQKNLGAVLNKHQEYPDYSRACVEIAARVTSEAQRIMLLHIAET